MGLLYKQCWINGTCQKTRIHFSFKSISIFYLQPANLGLKLSYSITIIFLDSKTTSQLLRYAFNGLLLNGIGYCFYLLATRIGLSPILAVTILYPIGIILSFFTHKLFSFKVVKSQKTFRDLITFTTIYFLGYLLNISLIYVFHNIFKWPHQIVQFCSIIIVAFFLFFLNKFFVFNTTINRS